MPPRQIGPPLKWTFEQVLKAILSQPCGETPQLLTTGGVSFVAKAMRTRDGRRFISLPHNNRIYDVDWGYQINNMGREGQRIGLYSVPIDCWVGVIAHSDATAMSKAPEASVGTAN